MKWIVWLLVFLPTLAGAQVRNPPYWWVIVGTSHLKIEIDSNNINFLTAVTKTAPARITTPQIQLMEMITVNCATKETLRFGHWKKSAPWELSICG